MKRIFHHYIKWEDYQNGMYNNSPETLEIIQKAVEVLSTPSICESAMKRVVSEWEYATEFNLTNSGCHRPWLGRSACCIYYGITENITRIAWWQLTSDQQNKANEIADIIINNWREQHIKKFNQQINLFNA